MEANISNTAEQSYDIYHDIKVRTNGEIYLGVVGPVRTGKSTFIKRFMDICVLPDMENENEKKRAMDELPQSASGTTIMTTEPKFIPSDAAVITPVPGMQMKVRLIDCVGFMVDGASGHIENNKERMVKTPWEDTPIPFTKAAEIGTRKVIEEHSTIGIVVTTDGSFSDIERSSFIPAEEKTINELKRISKPFVVLLNSIKPYSKDTIELAKEMKAKYNVNVLPINLDQLKKEDVINILQSVLKEFPIGQIMFFAPKWAEMLPDDHWLKKSIIDTAKEILKNLDCIKDVDDYSFKNDSEYIENVECSSVKLSDGTVNVNIVVKPGIYYNIISELTGTAIENEYELINTIKELAGKKTEYDNVKDALQQVEMSGFGVVTPTRKDIQIEEPVVIKNGNKYGVKIKASVPSINMIKTQINVEIAPIVGTKSQADDLIDYIKDNTKDNPDGIWDANIFGKTIEQIIDDSIYEKTHNMTQDSMTKIGDTLEKVVNENSGLVCLIV